jgi:2'-5' RNA ligase
MRLFVAIELPGEIKKEIGRVQDELRKIGAHAAWTRPEGIHLTLKFLGEAPDAKAPEVLRALSVVRGRGTVSLEVAGAGAFPNVKAPRVLWLGVAGESEKLAALQAAVEDAMAVLGFEREDRRFSPHLTLGRVKFLRHRDDWQRIVESVRDVRLGGFEADHISLIKSELRREGAVYTEVGRVELK